MGDLLSDLLSSAQRFRYVTLTTACPLATDCSSTRVDPTATMCNGIQAANNFMTSPGSFSASSSARRQRSSCHSCSTPCMCASPSTATTDGCLNPLLVKISLLAPAGAAALRPLCERHAATDAMLLQSVASR